MKKSIITFVAGAVLFGSVGVYAGQYIATENAFPIQLNGENVSMEGYNIDGSTYFKLRDISNTIGGFDVDFNNETIQIAKDGYIYATGNYEKIYPNNGLLYYADEKNMYGKISKLPQFNIDSDEAKALNESINTELRELITSADDLESISSEYYINGNILSLIIKIETTYNDVVGYIAHNIDLTTGNEVTNSALLQKCGTTDNDFMAYVKEILKERIVEYFNKSSEMNNKTYNEVYNEELYQYAISDRCCNMDIPMFVNSDGMLNCVPVFGTMTGGYEDILTTKYSFKNN